MFIYHVVSNDIGNILAVYGEKLLSEAQEKARSIEHSTGCKTYLHSGQYSSYQNRPHVGMSISMRGIKI